MSDKTENLIPGQFHKVEDVEEKARAARPSKKEFVEPKVSSPIDVLEATTFFQIADSGVATP